MSVRHFTIEIRPDDSALVLGGYSAPRLGGDKATARDTRERPLIPATALRGALRIELERLLRGRNPEALACSANRPEADPDAPPCPCPVCRLFGEPGRGTGTLRLGDAVLAPEVEEEARLRPSVAVSRRTGSAVEKHLAFVETTGDLTAAGADTANAADAVFRAPACLVGRGNRDDDETLAGDAANLRAACAALRAIGGGKARGLGWVECSARENTVAEPAEARPLGAGTGSLTVRFHAQSPLHFGVGRQLGFFQGTQRYAPGSTVRGALAFALLESGVAPADERFQSLFGRETQASFGSARAAGDVPSATRRKCRPEGHVFDDLAGELVRRAAARSGAALAVTGRGGCLHAGCQATKILPSELQAGAPELRLRVRTLTALNRLTGTSMDRKLYSVEAVEPEVVLAADVHGLTPESAALLAGLDGREVWLGGKRSKGMGRCRVEVTPEVPHPRPLSHLPPTPPPGEGRQETRASELFSPLPGKGGRETGEGPGVRASGAATQTEPWEAPPDPGGLAAANHAIEALDTAFREAWQALAAAAGLQPVLSAGELLLAIVLREPWSPGEVGAEGEALRQGPLGGALGTGLRRFDAFVELAEEGRFVANEAACYAAGEHIRPGEDPPRRVAAPGSVYVYAAGRDVVAERLGEWLASGRQGAGERRGLGWGRFVIRGPENDF